MLDGYSDKRYPGSYSLEETFYMRERNETEMNYLYKDEKEKEKILAEKVSLIYSPLRVL